MTQEHGFWVHSPERQRTIYFYAHSEEDQKSWVQDIRHNLEVAACVRTVVGSGLHVAPLPPPSPLSAVLLSTCICPPPRSLGCAQVLRFGAETTILEACRRSLETHGYSSNEIKRQLFTFTVFTHTRTEIERELESTNYPGRGVCAILNTQREFPLCLKSADVASVLKTNCYRKCGKSDCIPSPHTHKP